ncbi:hypothetical protein [Acetomicrobium sp.]|uniref:hypothetical protein n=1 Tax=Acetomicrobium sp. TaxID=1872099 RepID=UPI002FC687AE
MAKSGHPFAKLWYALKDVAKTLSESYGIKKNLVRKFVLDQERLERLEEEKDES